MVPFLKIAMTFALFHSFEILPSSRDLLNKILNGNDNSLLSSISTLGGIESGPCALCLFNLHNVSYYITAGVTLISANVMPPDSSHVTV